MGCNTSKENAQNENNDEDINKKSEADEKTNIKNDLTEKNTKSSSAKTITIRSNGSVINNKKSGTEAGEEEEEEAATKIQAAFRGHKTRKSIMKQPQTEKQPPQAEAEREPTREELENEFRLDDAELCHAATKIQASFRGHMTRKHQTETDTLKNNKVDEDGGDGSNKEEELDMDLTDPELNKAACKIQASFRGHMQHRKDGETSTTLN